MYLHPLVSPLIERHIHVKGKFFKYKVAGRTYGNDDYIISESLKEAFCLIVDTYMSLKNKDENSIRIAKEILGNSNYETLLSSLKKVELKILDTVLVILRENYLDTENDNVLASIDKNDKKTFTVYDNFFDQVGFKENRAGIFIHEIAHLCDFDEEDEMRELDSAECIKNICLCINGKITLEQIKAEHKKQQQSPQKDRRDGVLTYRPNGSRDPDGRYNSQKDGASGSGASNSNSSADKKTASKKSVAKKSKTENSSKKEKSFEEKAKNAKSSLNLQAGGIKFNSSKIWGAGNFEINNLEPNKEYTLAGEFTYKYEPIMENKTVTETSKIAIDIHTDENGSAKVNRLGIVGEYTGDGEATKYDGGELGIGVKLSLAAGKTSDNYKDIDKIKKDKDLTDAENRELREKYGLGYYGMFHACQQKWTNTKNIKAYSGGGISGQKDPDGLVEILNEYIEFDSITGETKISKGLKNDAKGRY